MVNSQLKKSQEEVDLFKRKYQQLIDEERQKNEKASKILEESEQLKKEQQRKCMCNLGVLTSGQS